MHVATRNRTDAGGLYRTVPCAEHRAGNRGVGEPFCDGLSERCNGTAGGAGGFREDWYGKAGLATVVLGTFRQ